MNNEDVERQKNEEIKAKKRKKMMIIGIPVIVFITIAGVIVSQTGMGGLMGNSVCEYTCRYDGWTLDGDICYREDNTQSSTTQPARLVGDVLNDEGQLKPDGKVTLADWNYIKNEIESNKTLTEDQKLIYDLNGDGKVNENDVSEYTTSTTEKSSSKPKYVCPTETKTETSEANGIKTTDTYYYTLTKDNTCVYAKKSRQERKAECKIDSQANSKKTENNSKENKDETLISKTGFELKEESLPDDIFYSETDELEFKYRLYKDNDSNYRGPYDGQYYYGTSYLVKVYSVTDDNNNGEFSHISRCMNTQNSGVVDYTFKLSGLKYKSFYYTIDVFDGDKCKQDQLLLQQKSKLYRSSGYSYVKDIKNDKRKIKLNDKLTVQVTEPNAATLKEKINYTYPEKYVIKYKYKIKDSESPYRSIKYRWFRNPVSDHNANSSSVVKFESQCMRVADGMTQTFGFIAENGKKTRVDLEVFKNETCSNYGNREGFISTTYEIETKFKK